MSSSEHNFAEEVLVSGEELRSYSAGGDLTQREPVGVSGDQEVNSSAAGADDFIGVVMYDVASGEEAAIAGDDCEVNLEVSEAVSAGDELVPDGSGAFETVATSSASEGVAIANESIGSGEIGEAYIFAVGGAKA